MKTCIVAVCILITKLCLRRTFTFSIFHNRNKPYFHKFLYLLQSAFLFFLYFHRITSVFRDFHGRKGGGLAGEAQQTQRKLKYFDSSLRGLKHLHLQTECGWEGRSLPICKQNAHMIGFQTLACFEARLNGCKKWRGLGGRNPLNLQTECSHDGFQKRLICFEASLRGSKKRVVGLQPPSFGNRMLERLKEGGGGLGGVRIPQICKQNARMMGFKRLMCGEASLHASKKKGDPICSLFLVKGGWESLYVRYIF